MKINHQTKIAAIIKHNNDVIEIMASINKNFGKLRNPFLRRVLASRVSIEDASIIGKCDINVIMNKLKEIGFEIEEEFISTPKKTEVLDNNVLSNIIQSEKLITLDVRPTIEQGKDPFTEIINTINKLPEGYALKLINSFEPIPLIKILNNRGFSSEVINNQGVVTTYFIKTSSQKKEGSASIIQHVPKEEFALLVNKYKINLLELDVRKLEMPGPMVYILSALDKLDTGKIILVHHRKIPTILLAELETLQYKTWVVEMEADNIKILISKWKNL